MGVVLGVLRRSALPPPPVPGCRGSGRPGGAERRQSLLEVEGEGLSWPRPRQLPAPSPGAWCRGSGLDALHLTGGQQQGPWGAGTRTVSGKGVTVRSASV